MSRVGIVGCLRAYLILYCNNFRVHQIRCYHPGSHHDVLQKKSNVGQLNRAFNESFRHQTAKIELHICSAQVINDVL